MSDWKKESLRKKNYRRGGLEPDPPLLGKHKKKVSKLFRLEHIGLFHKEWWTWGSYETLEIAKEVAEQKIRNHYPSWTNRYRIVYKKTKEVLWESEDSGEGSHNGNGPRL